MSSLKDIYWMSSPLSLAHSIEQDNALSKFLGPLAQVPSSITQSSTSFQHWTLEIDGKCYELSMHGKKTVQKLQVITDACEPRNRDSTSWHGTRKKHGISPKRLHVGQTRMTPEQIQTEVDFIWNTFNHGLYMMFTQNCQNFARMLYYRITVAPDDKDVLAEQRDLWDPFPVPVSHGLAEISKNSLRGSAGIGSTLLYSEYLAAVASVKAAEAGGVVAAAAAAEAIEGSATASASASASTSTTAGSLATAGSSTATTTASATATTGEGAGTLGATQTTATTTTAGTAHGTGTAAAGVSNQAAGAGAAKGGGAGAAKFGFGAKTAGVGHAAMHGAGAAKAAAIGTAMTKAGGVAAFAHPIAGAAIAGAGMGLVLLANGKKDKRWIKRNKNRKAASEITVADALELEEQMLSQEAEQDIDQHLALLHVTTEPSSTETDERSDEHSEPFGEDIKRSQTAA